MARRIGIGFVMALLLFGACGLAVQGAAARVKLLLVDETQTLENSVRVQVLASLVKKTGAFDLTARLSDVATSFDHPLEGQTVTAPYDVVLVIPKGLDDGQVEQIWIVSRPIDRDMPPAVRSALGLLASLAEKVFPGVDAVDVTQDLLPGYFAALFMQEGRL